MPTYGSTAYGSLNNFDVVNDTGERCYGFSIELDDIHSTDITYTYDWNHYGVPKISEDNSIAGHPVVFVRYESKRNADGSFASFTNPQDPLNPLAPTDGHAFTDPSVNLGGEHFGVGYIKSPSAVKYHWLVEDRTNPGVLVLGPAVNIATPQFVYIPPMPGLMPAQVQAVIEPLAPEDAAPELFGVPVWVKCFKTVQPSGDHVRLDELLTDDQERDDDPNWAGSEPPETEIEWMVFQKRPASNPGEDEIAGLDDLPEGDETVTRRYEFYVYAGLVNEEDGEAQCSNPENCPGAVGEYIGAQMAGFNVESPLGLIDHLQDGGEAEPYTERTIVVGGNTPYQVAIKAGGLPTGLRIDPVTGVLSGTPTESGMFRFTISATDADTVQVWREYSLNIARRPDDSAAPIPDVAVLPVITGECSAVLPPPPTATDALGNQIIGVTDSPAIFGLGSFLVTWTFTDSRMNSSQQTQQVYVVDTIAPTISALDLTAVASGVAGQVVDFATPTATDECAGVAPVSCSPALTHGLPSGPERRDLHCARQCRQQCNHNISSACDV